MVEHCPECDGELVVGAAHNPSRGVHRIYECNSCGTEYELTEVTEERMPPSDPTESGE